MIEPTHFLKTIQIDHFGALHDRTITGLTPGLNMLYGPNESGKTTTATFIGGVLFGWPDARGANNDYRPIGAERSGTLVFSPYTLADDEIRCTRVRNAEGIQQGPCPELLDDIDSKTFYTIFSLDSDELRHMDRTSDVTAHLLTAGSGTHVSPAQAAQKLDDEIAGMFSKSASHPRSLANLKKQLATSRAEMAKLANEAMEFEHEDKEYTQLMQQRESLSRSLDRLNDDIHSLTTNREKIIYADQQKDRLQQDMKDLSHQKDDLSQAMAQVSDKRDKPYRKFDAGEERMFREALHDASEEQHRLEHTVENAKLDLRNSMAVVEALRESKDESRSPSHKAQKRTIQSLLFVLMPLLFAVLGVVVFVRGRIISSLSVTALGSMLVLFSVALACAAFIILLRPDRVEERLNDQISDAEVVVQKDKKKLEACEKALEAHREKIEVMLADAGLEAAQGNMYRAYALLDTVADLRAEESVLDQKMQAVISQEGQIQHSMKQALIDKSEGLRALGETSDVPIEELDERLARKTKQRENQMRAIEVATERSAKLEQILSTARFSKDFDRVKLDNAQFKSRYNDSQEELARLLLAKRLLRSSIVAWESKSQPEVYRCASELFSEMTLGTWTQVRLTTGGSLVVVDDNDRSRSPEHLSLGTLQQLYLALRLALLLIADNVGRNIPVICDDILVNFDAERRMGAARALVKVSQQRQIILFTCHEEVVTLMQMVDPSTNIVRL